VGAGKVAQEIHTNQHDDALAIGFTVDNKVLVSDPGVLSLLMASMKQ
jgi:hypothetical protein